MTITIEEGKWYCRADGSEHGPAAPNLTAPDDGVMRYPWCVGATIYTAEGQYYYDQASHILDLVAEVPNPADVAAQAAVEATKPESAEDRFRRVCMEASEYALIKTPKDLPIETALRIYGEVRAIRWPTDRSPAEALQDLHDAETFDIKADIADEAKRIVSGARRSAYGKPEQNFERIARFWDAYFKNTGRDVTITAADVSPLMRMVKEARLCESPTHRDSFVDLLGYAMTGAEVNGVNKS